MCLNVPTTRRLMRHTAILGTAVLALVGPLTTSESTTPPLSAQLISAGPTLNPPEPLGRSTIEAVDVELSIDFTDEQLGYYRMQTMLDRDFEAMRMYRPGYSFWQHVFAIPDGSVAFGSAEDGRLLVVFPTRGDCTRGGLWVDESLSSTLVGAQLERRLARRRDQVEVLLEPAVGEVVHNETRGEFLRPNAERYGAFLREWGSI